MANTDLTIPESILLLALHDDSGEKRGTFLEYALAGAALTELVLQNRLKESGKKLEIASAAPVGDPFIDTCLAAVEVTGPGKEAKAYIQHIGGKKDLFEPLYDGLVRRGILDEQTSKIFWVFNHTKWPERNPAPEKALEARLRLAITGSGAVDARDGAIIALAHHTDILKYNFDRDLLKQHKDRLKKIAEGALLPPTAAKETIDAMTTAVMIAAIMPAIIVTTT